MGFNSAFKGLNYFWSVVTIYVTLLSGCPKTVLSLSGDSKYYQKLYNFKEHERILSSNDFYFLPPQGNVLLHSVDNVVC